jgi:uncharacterized lipoprotein YddW (UPF0748 family)
MFKGLKTVFFWIALSVIFVVLFQLLTVHSTLLSAQSAPPKREFRALWITTLGNMDWPSRRGMTPDEQKQQFIYLLEQCKVANLNAVIVQIRPSADAFYPSAIEPWSEWLSGKQGRAPQPYYDPLAFMLEEAHKRDIEFHAWINPFRAVYHNRFSDIHPGHIINRQKNWLIENGSGKMFDPGIPEVREYITTIIADIVSRYDVDGIHFDDYFYPYPMPGTKIGDEGTFKKHNRGFRDINAWRRDNINQLIESVSQTIQTLNPQVKFGVSPAGVWRNIQQDPEGSHTRSGYTSYDHLHADTRLWLEKGWIDYIVPQVYYSTKKESVNYRTLVRWWDRNVFGRHLYIGHAAFKVYWESDKSWYNKEEIPQQLRYNRQLGNVHGSAFFRAESFLYNRGNFRDSLTQHYYRNLALQPVMHWKDRIPPQKPEQLKVLVSGRGTELTWLKPAMAPDGQYPHRYVVYKIPEKETLEKGLQNPANIQAMLSADIYYWTDRSPQNSGEYLYAVTSLDRLHNESEAALPEKEPVLVLNGLYTYEEFMYYYRFFQSGLQKHFGWTRKFPADIITTGQ